MTRLVNNAIKYSLQSQNFLYVIKNQVSYEVYTVVLPSQGLEHSFLLYCGFIYFVGINFHG